MSRRGRRNTVCKSSMDSGDASCDLSIVRTSEFGAASMENLIYAPLFQGETRVSDQPNEVMTTILGSCVAACMWDPVAGVGGMNHFLLPGDMSDRSSNLRYGVNAMELLINGLLKKGADRARLKVKLFGGAKMFDGSAEIGVKNARFAEWYMENENLQVVNSCLGGQRGRKIRFWPVSGRAQRCFMSEATDADVIAARQASDESRPDYGDVQLF